ncbi:MAG: hypothetical protein WCG06_02845, partial [Candidatus Omnitrophota bacterium]
LGVTTDEPWLIHKAAQFLRKASDACQDTKTKKRFAVGPPFAENQQDQQCSVSLTLKSGRKVSIGVDMKRERVDAQLQPGLGRTYTNAWVTDSDPAETAEVTFYEDAVFIRETNAKYYTLVFEDGYVIEGEPRSGESVEGFLRRHGIGQSQNARSFFYDAPELDAVFARETPKAPAGAGQRTREPLPKSTQSEMDQYAKFWGSLIAKRSKETQRPDQAAIRAEADARIKQAKKWLAQPERTGLEELQMDRNGTLFDPATDERRKVYGEGLPLARANFADPTPFAFFGSLTLADQATVRAQWADKKSDIAETTIVFKDETGRCWQYYAGVKPLEVLKVLADSLEQKESAAQTQGAGQSSEASSAAKSRQTKAQTDLSASKGQSTQEQAKGASTTKAQHSSRRFTGSSTYDIDIAVDNWQPPMLLDTTKEKAIRFMKTGDKKIGLEIDPSGRLNLIRNQSAIGRAVDPRPTSDEALRHFNIYGPLSILNTWAERFGLHATYCEFGGRSYSSVWEGNVYSMKLRDKTAHVVMGSGVDLRQADEIVMHSRNQFVPGSGSGFVNLTAVDGLAAMIFKCVLKGDEKLPDQGVFVNYFVEESPTNAGIRRAQIELIKNNFAGHPEVSERDVREALLEIATLWAASEKAAVALGYQADDFKTGFLRAHVAQDVFHQTNHWRLALALLAVPDMVPAAFIFQNGRVGEKVIVNYKSGGETDLVSGKQAPMVVDFVNRDRTFGVAFDTMASAILEGIGADSRPEAVAARKAFADPQTGYKHLSGEPLDYEILENNLRLFCKLSDVDMRYIAFYTLEHRTFRDASGRVYAETLINDILKDTQTQFEGLKLFDPDYLMGRYGMPSKAQALQLASLLNYAAVSAIQHSLKESGAACDYETAQAFLLSKPAEAGKFIREYSESYYESVLENYNFVVSFSKLQSTIQKMKSSRQIPGLGPVAPAAAPVPASKTVSAAADSSGARLAKVARRHRASVPF